MLAVLQRQPNKYISLCIEHINHHKSASVECTTDAIILNVKRSNYDAINLYGFAVRFVGNFLSMSYLFDEE